MTASLAEGRHFTAGELRRALGDGFRDVDRWRAVVHFGRMRCEVCWRLLEELATVAVSPRRAQDSPARAFDPVLAVLRRLATAYLDPAAVDQLRPVLRFWLENARLERLGFFRLLLEGTDSWHS